MFPSTSLSAEEQRLAEDARRAKNWKRWGPYLAERQWGTVREDYSPDGSSWSYLPARTGPQPRLSLGRRRAAGHHRPRMPPLLCRGPMERAGPRPQRTPVRPGQHRGEPRRGREGVLFLSRRHAHRLVSEGPLQIPAGRVSLRLGCSKKTAAGAETNPSSSCWKRASLATTAISTSSSSTPRRLPTTF